MKRIRESFVLTIFLVLIMLTGCSNESTKRLQSRADEPLQKKAALLVSGALGDKSFFDSANDGMKAIETELGWVTKVLEVGPEPSKWEPALSDLSEQDYDLIICGTPRMQETIEEVALRFPDQKYVVFDASVDYSKSPFHNVHSILYRQNEGAYLAGALAAMVTNSDLPKVNNTGVIGFLGGMNIPVINDFLLAYINGALNVDPRVKVIVSYVDDFTDPAKGKELSLVQYELGADIGFNVAAGSGLGQIDAAREKDRYVIGVDSDQAMLFSVLDPKKAELVLTSMLKRVDNSLVRVARLYEDGELEFGKAESLGLKEEAVGLANNQYYLQIVPLKIREEIDSIAQKIISGQINVPSIFEIESGALEKLLDSVRL